jgi:hypothetical protein
VFLLAAGRELLLWCAPMSTHASHWVDRLYVRWNPVGSFFHEGWGDERATAAVVAALGSPPPPVRLDPRWGPESRRRWGRVRDGYIMSPVQDGTLPYESERARVRMIMPLHESARPTPVCVHLAATGEHDFGRRLALARPLLARGIGAIFLENALYGARRPAGQLGSEVRTVSDLMTMGRATVEEARGLALWLASEGHPVVFTGYSMGGQMAALAGALVPFPVGIVAVAAPPSAREVFLDGLLSRVTSWSALAAGGSTAVARERLGAILESSHVTRQPAPLAPEAAIVIVGRHDGYVIPEIALLIHHHWPGSELRWLEGGHVRNYVASFPAARQAILDVVSRLVPGFPT